MIGASALRIVSQDSGSWAETALTTEGGQDKRAHLARPSVGCFSGVFAGFAHLAPGMRKVPNRPKTLFSNRYWHISRCANGR